MCWQVGELIKLAGYPIYDDQVQRLEEDIFGYQPSIDWNQQYPSKVYSSICSPKKKM